MATYLELYELHGNGTLRNRITAAISIAARNILQEATVVAARKTWADEALISPDSKTNEMVWYILAEHNGLTKEQITGALDSSILTAVNAAIDKRVAPAA